MLIIILAFFLNFALATDYCILCKNYTHTMCKYKEGPADNCLNYTRITLSPGEKRYILDIHNDIRNHVASGEESRGALGNQPSAADMFLLDWDNELADIAQRWADQCISINATTQHDACKRTEHFDVGQNIVTAVTTDGELPELSILILNWYKQIVNVIPSDVDDFIGIWRGKHLIGQYTQLVWAKTRLVGCAAVAFKEATNDSQYNIRFVCNYGPAGNTIGQPIYERGKPCSKCPQRVCDKLRPNLCSVLGGKKAVDMKKPKNVFSKKYKDKASFFNYFMDINKNISILLNISLLNMSETPERSVINTTNTPDFNHSDTINMKKYFDSINTTSTFEDGLLNTTETNISRLEETENYENFNLRFNITYPRENSYELNETDHLEDATNYTFPSETTGITTLKNDSAYYTAEFTEYSNVILISNVDEEDLQDIMFNTSSTNTSKEGYFNNFMFRVKFASRIKLLIDDFFNQTMHSDLGKFKLNEKSVIDLTKDKCEKQVKTDTGIILVQNCDQDSKKPRLFEKKPIDTRRKIMVNGDNVILPGNRRFKRAKGFWRLGHCRCARILQSGSDNFIVTYFSMIYSLVHFFIS